MVYLNRRGRRRMLRCYLYYINGFVIEWRQAVNSKAKIVGIGNFNQKKNVSNYKKKGFGDAMRKRILNLNNEKRNEKKM